MPEPAPADVDALDEAFFLFDRVACWQSLFELPRYVHADPETVSEVLRAGERFAAKVLAPSNAEGDQTGARLVDGRVVLPSSFHTAYREFCHGGWPGFDLPRRYGGQDLPLLAQVAFAEQLNRANVAFGMLPIMLRAGAHLLLEHASPDLVDQVVPALTTGAWGATICISEPQAGSDVARIATAARPLDDGRYAVSGTKAWISYGDHDLTEQAVHLLLARTPEAPTGSRGLSLFLLPRWRFEDAARNGWAVQRLENKLGLHGSPTCVLQFDDAIAYRIGPLHQGLRCMFTMVNLMRLEVAVQGIAVASLAAQRAARYAHERLQGGAAESAPVPIVQHPDIQRLLRGMQARLRPLRALTYEVAHQLDLARAGTTPETRAQAIAWAAWWLPVCKTTAAETAFDIASDALQVAGGFGYTREGGLEQLLRDSRVMGVYEGTSGIQALDLVLRKVRQDHGARAIAICERMLRDCAPAAARRPAICAEQWRAHASRVVQMLLDTTRAIAEFDERRIAAGAVDYLRLAGLAGCAWMWIRMLDGTLHEDRAADARRADGECFFTYWLPLAEVYRARTLDAAR